MTGVLLGYVRRVLGDEGVAEVLERARETTPTEELEDPTNWSSYDDTLHRFQAAAEVLGDPDVGRVAGADLFRHYSSAEVIELLRSLGSPAEALRVIADTATKQSTVVTMECVELTETSALVSAVTSSPIRRDRIFCGYTAGALSAMPTVFGLADAEIEEIECQTRGDGRCLYRVTWDPDTATDPESHARFLEARVASVTGRFEALEKMASELASISDIDCALETVARRAGVAIWAPKFLLAVRLPREREIRIHAIGLEDQEAERCAREILEDEPNEHGGARLVVEVASSEQRFGRLAAIYPEGHRFLPEERRLLQAYAGHAAAALATAAALDEARRKAATMGALFDLATRLAEVGSVAEVADRIVSLVPSVLECDEASVFLWEHEDAVLRCVSRSKPSPGASLERPRRVSSVRPDASFVASLARRPDPVVFDGGSSGSVSRIGTAAGYPSGVIVPVVARRSLVGILVVWADRWVLSGAPIEPLRDALHGVASIAATALDSARLLDDVRHQAGHDALTGLPNSRLLVEMANSALANAYRQGYSVGVLFIDLDNFKDVNDELGHHAGDELLVELGARLQTAVRKGDTVARLGGDEFGILLPHVAHERDAELVSRRILDVLSRPAVVLDTQVHLSGSIGIAVSGPAHESFDELLSRADTAMYKAKTEGRNRFAAHGF
jgi:diguanylate cyclase (GGDEF)-like protein